MSSRILVLAMIFTVVLITASGCKDKKKPTPQPTPGHVTLEPTRGGPPHEKPTDFVLLMTGFLADLALCELAGVELTPPSQSPVYNEETNVPGVFVAGTIVTGTQESFNAFIETSHVHVPRILAAVRKEYD